MKILWQSASPACNSGYGKVSRELIRRLKAAGHTITVATKHPSFGRHTWEGTDILPGQDVGYLCDFMKAYKYDLSFTLWDIWMLADKRKFPKDRWAAYVPIDTNALSVQLGNVLKETRWQVAMSRHGERAMTDAGLAPMYGPHGVDMTTLRPDAEARATFRKDFGWDDETFVIGSVGLNYRDDRKGFIPLMQAFKVFHERHPKSRLYLHTDAGTKGGDAIPFARIANSLGIGAWVAWPDQMSYYLNLIGEDWLRAAYNGMDVFALPTRGEGFGIPAIDAQACGVPVILTNNTTGPELCETGWLIDVAERDLRWLTNDAWRHEPQMDAVLDALETAHTAWRSNLWPEMKAQARERVLGYDWANVWAMYFEPIFARIEHELGEAVK
jgi:glycosyltransferase involved in cell wall biosynthesis